MSDRNSNVSSKLLESSVNELAKLPGIGKKTALRMALHLLKQEKSEVEALGNSIIKMKNELRFCKKCLNISDDDFCQICLNPKRSQNIVCVIEDIRDVLSVENTSQFRGIYHILGGLISPIDGISPSDLSINKLEQRLETENIDELIFALPTTVEGDTTAFYLFKRLHDKVKTISIIARGVSIGNDLEYTDEITLGRSITNRTLYSGQ